MRRNRPSVDAAGDRGGRGESDRRRGERDRLGRPTEASAKATDVNAAKPTRGERGETDRQARDDGDSGGWRRRRRMTTRAPRTISSPRARRPWRSRRRRATTRDARGFGHLRLGVSRRPERDAHAERGRRRRGDHRVAETAPKSAPSPKPTPEVRPRSEARNPRARPTPVSTPTSDSGGVAEDVSASTDIEDDLHEPVAADEDTGPRPASNVDASTSGVAVAVADDAADARRGRRAPSKSPSRMSRTPSRTSSTRTNPPTPPVPRLRPRRL